MGISSDCSSCLNFVNFKELKKMKKILILIAFLINFVFALDCCTEPFTTPPSSSWIVISDVNEERQTTRGASCTDEVLPILESTTCEGEGILKVVSRFGSSHSAPMTQCGAYYITENVYDVNVKTYNQNCECTEESTPLSELPDINDTTKTWELVAYKQCNDSQTQGDLSIYENSPFADRATTSQYVGCCGSNINYYIKKEIPPCPVGEERVNGECAVNPLSCPSDMIDNGIRAEDECSQSIANSGGTGSFSTQDSFSICCVPPPPNPQFECSSKGANWSLYGATDIDDCQSVVNGTTILSSSWETGTDISATCCILNSDTNDTATPDNNDTATPDNNDTSTPDTNDTSTPDNNNSDLDDTNDKLDDLNSKTDDTNDKLDDLNSKTDDTNDKLDSANEILNDIKNNSDETNTQLTDIKDILNGTNEEGVDGDKEISYDGAMGSFNEFRAMVSEGFNNVRNTFKDAPQLSPSQSQCDFSFTLTNGTNISVDVHSYIVKLRPYLDIIWIFLFALIGFKIYLYVFVKITEFIR